jgi:serine/threonine-protein kinase HipA
MGRASHGRTLNVWANGLLIGAWRVPARGQMEFEYEREWPALPEARPLSLSLPMGLEGGRHTGARVDDYFDNLLPDNEAIRRRLQERFRTASINAFDLLEAIGRDCAGAVQLLPEGAAPDHIRRIDASPLDDAQIERALLIAVARPGPPGLRGDDPADDDAFRISIAGAQEKTAFTLHQGRWCRPHGATPTTHIFKLPLGLVGNRRADMRTSVENEWLCAQLLAAFGVPVAGCEIGRFGSQKVLIVERFDRALHSSGKYWLRLPQEDFCQATATPASRKYEADGGPGLTGIARILQNSENREGDLATLLRAQLLFWMLAATDGHAKNFSLRLLAGSRYRLTPLYDVLSAWPVVGRRADQLDRKRLLLAMSLRGKNAHFKLEEIFRRHFNQAAHACGLGADMEAIIEDVLARVSGAIAGVERTLPTDFPADVFDTITGGLRAMARKLAAMPSA